MTEIALAESIWAELINSVCYNGRERCAVLLTNEVLRPNGEVRLLVYALVVPDAVDYASSGAHEVELTPAFVARISKLARDKDSRIAFVHCHPDGTLPAFSEIDDLGELMLATFLGHRQPGAVHAAVVLSDQGVAARRLGSAEAFSIVSIGSERRVLTSLPSTESPSARFDRQVRALGLEGQRTLETLTIGIVGLGGTGSIIAQELVHLGIRRFILLDPDVIEETNLNRVSGAVPADIGKPKVEVAERYISAVANSEVVSRLGDVIYARDGRQLLNADIVFGCTDSHGSRAVLEQIAYQYLIPTIDMGTVIVSSGGRVTHIAGGVQMLAPGLACLTCSNLLDPNQVRSDMMTAFERQADPYIQGSREPAPAVMSFNSTVVSLAVTMMLAAVTSLPISARRLVYRALSSSVRPVLDQPVADCVVCSSSGRLCRGDSLPFPGRQD
jgi:molybdopterin/thiamine biosynthesis adenylyltransferase